MTRARIRITYTIVDLISAMLLGMILGACVVVAVIIDAA